MNFPVPVLPSHRDIAEIRQDIASIREDIAELKVLVTRFLAAHQDR